MRTGERVDEETFQQAFCTKIKAPKLNGSTMRRYTATTCKNAYKHVTRELRTNSQ